MERVMKLTIPALLITALIASPVAFAQGTNYTATTSKPGASFEKDDSATPTKRPKKRHAMSHKKTHHAKHMNSKAQTMGSGGSSTGAGANKDETTPKSR
jgi:hypothetical protein